MPTQNQALYLHEQLLLLALRDEKGTFESGASYYPFDLAGALLAELALHERIRIAEGKKALADLLSVEPVGDETLDEALGMIAGSKRRRDASTWVSRFTGIKRLHHRIAEGLYRRSVLRDSTDQVLLIFKRKAYPTIDPGPEQALISLLLDAIFSESHAIDPRVAIAIALADATGLLRVHFGRRELKARKARLKEIASDDHTAAAARGAIAAAQAAQAATIAATVVVTTAATSG